MTLMVRVLALATLFAVTPRAAAVQAPVVLHIKVVLLDADGKAMPVPRHALLISDNPATAAPRQVLTGLDGTANVRLRPGSYTVESDRPVAFQGKAYQWAETITVAAGRDAALELTSANAEVGPASPEMASAAAPLEADPSLLLTQWQDSVVGLWTPTTHASGFLIDASGLLATNQRVIGTSTSVEVQLTAEVKVAARVIVADAVRDVAVLRIDPKVVAAVRPVPLGCALAEKPSIVDGQEIFTIGVPFRQQKGMTAGTATRVWGGSIASDLRLATGSAGGPVFAAGGAVVGITSVVDGDDRARGDFRVVGIGDVCVVVASAETKAKDAAPPGGAHLPVDPARPFPVDALKDAVQHRAGSLSPYQMSSADFDIAFITPVMIYAAQNQAEQASRRERGGVSREPGADGSSVRPLADFSNWSEYVADVPPVLLVRVTPKFVEGFWTKVARGAAQTQGVAVPAIKRFKSGFLRMRVFCGDAEVTPIHPFKLERRVSESEAIYEGLYAFDPGALGPSCASVKLVLYSEKQPEKGDSRVVDARVIQQIWNDFEPYRRLVVGSPGEPKADVDTPPGGGYPASIASSSTSIAPAG